MSILGRVTVYVGRVRAHRETRRHVSRLAAISDHLLDDIGVTRADADRMRAEAFGVRANLWS